MENYKDLRKEVKEIKSDIKNLKENHLAHIQGSIANIEVSIAKNTTDTEWLKKTYWIIATAVLGGLVMGIANLLKG